MIQQGLTARRQGFTLHDCRKVAKVRGIILHVPRVTELCAQRLVAVQESPELLAHVGYIIIRRASSMGFWTWEDLHGQCSVVQMYTHSAGTNPKEVGQRYWA